MNLSTSSFNGLKTAAVVLALLLVVEAGMRRLEPHLSADVAHIENIPQIVSGFGKADHDLLFLGSSITRHGVDVAALEPVLAAQGVAPDAFSLSFIYPDASDILDWAYVYHHYLSLSAAQPDVIVVNFAGDRLEDVEANPQQIRRIARHHTSLRDVPGAFAQDFTTLSQRADFLLSKTFVSFAHRERVRMRLMATLPLYRQTQRSLNESQLAQAAEPTPTAAPTSNPDQVTLAGRYTRLKRFLAEIDTRSVRVVFVATPVRDPYTLDPALWALLTDHGAELLDTRAVPGLTPAVFDDALHLSPEGAEIYSRALAKKLAPLLKAELRGDLQSSR